MGNWYRVTKRINGRFYDYWQRTYRVGNSVRTENKYIGPSGTMVPVATSSNGRTTGFIPGYGASSPSVAKVQIAPQNEKYGQPWTPEHAKLRFNRYDGLTPQFTRILKKLDEQQRREDELIQYGPLAKRKAKQHAALNDAKKRARGNKYLNPFLGQAIKKK